MLTNVKMKKIGVVEDWYGAELKFLLQIWE